MRIGEVKVGQEYRLNRDYNTNFLKGSIITVSSKNYGYVYFNNGKCNVSAASLDKIENTKQAITKKINQKKEEIKELQDKLDFMKESGESTYNENTFKAYQTLKLMENKKLSDIDKAKLISKLITK